MTTEYALIGLIAAVPIAVIIVALVFRGYDITVLLKRRKKDDE